MGFNPAFKGLKKNKSIADLSVKEVLVYYCVNMWRREPRNWQYLTRH